MNINTTNAAVTVSNAAADGGSVSPVVLWVLALLGVVMMASMFGPVLVDIVRDTAHSLRVTLRARRAAAR